MEKSDKQIQALLKVRNHELELVNELDPNFYCQGRVGAFVSLYLQSEVFAKKLQRYYRTDTKKDGKEDLDIRVLKASIQHFGLDFSDNQISALFKGGKGTAGKSQQDNYVMAIFIHYLKVIKMRY